MIEKVIIITPSLIDFSSGELKIGGLETYVKDLALLCKNAGYKVVIYQSYSNETEEAILEDCIVKSFVGGGRIQTQFNFLYEKYNDDSTIFIIATDQMDIKSKANNVITIQHGIAFDVPGNLIDGFWGSNSILQHINKFLRCIKNVRRLYNTRNTVCVDYNYYNWFRTLGTIPKFSKVSVIPNYTSKYLSIDEFEQKIVKPRDVKRIVFARRFVEYRGTLMFANVIQRLIAERDDVDVTFAGAGPLKNHLEKMFRGVERVHFSSFNTSETIQFHKRFDIAVVPTIFSEGTSLSLCEAMAAGCMGVATHVGGLTNIIIDSFNGFLCAPSEESLYETLSNVLDLPSAEFEKIVRSGYSTVLAGFSRELWQKKWLRVIRNTK